MLSDLRIRKVAERNDIEVTGSTSYHEFYQKLKSCMKSNIPTGLVGAPRLFNWTHKHASFTESFMEFHNFLKKVLEPHSWDSRGPQLPYFQARFRQENIPRLASSCVGRWDREIISPVVDWSIQRYGQRCPPFDPKAVAGLLDEWSDASRT